MKKEDRQLKVSYQAPKVELIKLGQSLSFLVQSFSSEGELDPFKEGEELGLDADGNPIVESRK